jgi:hypothetical protein
MQISRNPPFRKLLRNAIGIGCGPTAASTHLRLRSAGIYGVRLVSKAGQQRTTTLVNPANLCYPYKQPLKHAADIVELIMPAKLPAAILLRPTKIIRVTLCP